MTHRGPIQWTLRNPIMAAVVAVIIADVLLLFSGARILVSEKYDQQVSEEGSFSHGITVSPIDNPIYRCEYFTGRGFKMVEISAQVRDECPFVYRPS